jgi:toxin ParE1/3/4
MPRVIRSAEAFRSLKRYSPKAAERLKSEIKATCQRLARSSESGEPCDDLEAGLRLSAVGDYVLLYRRTDEGIEIARLLHGARDLPQFFEPDA